jgi:uncharacterized protein YgiM (DUF1202 family)
MNGFASRIAMLGTLALLTACAPETKQPASVGSQANQAKPAAPPAAASAPAAKEAPPPKPPADAPQALVVSVGKANLREKPDTKAKIVNVLTKGTKVVVVGKGNQWYRVRLHDGTEGWLAESVAAPAN